MTDDHITPEQLLEAAKEIAKQIMSMPTQMKKAKFEELIGENKELQTLVTAQLVKMTADARAERRVVKKGDNMTKEGQNPTNATLLHFTKINGRKMLTVRVTGVEYVQHMAAGDLFFDTLCGSKDIVQRFMETFTVKNDKVGMIVAFPDGHRVLFQAPICISSIKANSVDTLGNSQLHQIKVKFFKEVVTLDLNDDDEVTVD